MSKLEDDSIVSFWTLKELVLQNFTVFFYLLLWGRIDRQRELKQNPKIDYIEIESNVSSYPAKIKVKYNFSGESHSYLIIRRGLKK